jgi:hypothetical protein
MCNELTIFTTDEVSHKFENGWFNYYRQGDELVVYTINPLREIAFFRNDKVASISMRWLAAIAGELAALHQSASKEGQ